MNLITTIPFGLDLSIKFRLSKNYEYFHCLKESRWRF
jgi:hypothetical protein